MTSRQECKKGKHVSNYLPQQTSEITSGEQKEGHVSQDLPPQSDAIISQGGTSIANKKDEVEFETEMVIRDLPVKTIEKLKEIYKKQYNPSKHTSLETFALDMSIVNDKARMDRQHFLWLIGMYYKDVLWAKNKMEPWVVKATEDVKSDRIEQTKLA